MKTELLAPAKDKETAISAIDCGCDAVYIGASAFGARHNAPNSLADIKEVVDYAHKFWVKVFVTLNTILTDDELEEAVTLAVQLNKIGVDALIIQDMGLLKRLADIKLNIHLHASTQCDNYLPQKVKFFNDIGISRVVLARETSIKTIKQMHEQNPALELESFIHGALCVSFSGQCYLSQYIGGRSANRGECAQPCRKKYTVINENGDVIKKDFYALCLKDFNASEKINNLINAGITSFKIEGRLKDSNYVKNIVSYYRQKLKNKTSSGKSFYTFTPNPEKTFNRGFTEYFLESRTDCFNFISPKSRGEYIGEIIEIKQNCFKIKTKAPISPQDGLFWGNDGILVNKVDNGFIYPNKPVKLNLGTKIYRNFDSTFEKELAKTVKRQIGINVIVNSKNLTIIDEDNVSIEIEVPSNEASRNPEKMNENFIKQFSKTGESDFYIQNIKIESDIPFMPVGKINEFRRQALGTLMNKRIQTFNSSKIPQKKIKYTQYFLPEVDYRANIHNKEAKNFYENCGCKVLEPSLETNIPNKPVALMRCKHCIKYALNRCKSKEKLFLIDEKGTKYPLEFDCKNCEMSINSP